MKKQKPIKPQPPWLITLHSEVQLEGQEKEFDPGYIEFEHRQTRVSIKQEIDRIKGRGAYINQSVPTLLDIWNMLTSRTPGSQKFIYKDWVVEHEPGCFVCSLADRLTNKFVIKRIISHYTCSKQNFAVFLDMLDKWQEQHREKPSTILDINFFRDRKEA